MTDKEVSAIMGKSRKKRQDKDNLNELQNDTEMNPREDEPIDEEEEREESESEDVFAEDESDLAMLRKLENDDAEKAFKEFTFGEEVGFNPMYDWSTVPEVEREHYQLWLDMDEGKLRETATKRLNAFQRWMLACACMRQGIHDLFRELAIGIIKLRKRPAELLLEDIYLELIWDFVSTKTYDSALEWLDKFEQVFPSEKTVVLRVRGLILIDQGDIDKGKAAISELINLPFNHDIKGFEQDKSSRDTCKYNSVIQYEVGYALMNMKHYDLALYYFERARSLAQINDDYELMMSIDNAVRITTRHKNGEIF
ncbi:MAG: hypothetical protein J6S69_05455 [Proteobacteria bacterium]|nr:hypothetical protein [Pseudomonadota bacterium]